jgi:DNA-binding HxlR family transcriptional regulator
MAALDLLGRRWALGVVWALRERALGFSQLRAELGGVSTSVLADRLRELREAGVLTDDQAGRYLLTPTGAHLLEALTPLQRWAVAWSESAGDRTDAGEPASR